ncbi:MAG: adenine deaminase [Myxococcales bacterium]|nr:adenine deaminase [Myxococcales bacterium]
MTPSPQSPTSAQLARRIDAAMGRTPCDLVLTNAVYLDVFSLAWRKGAISVHDGVIVGVEAPLRARRRVDLKGARLVPGFIDAHVHIESSLVTPEVFETLVLPKGTTTAICDPHELTNVIGIAGLKRFLASASHLRLDLRVMLSSCVPATHAGLETNGAGVIDYAALAPLAKHPHALGLAEMMNMPGVLHNDPGVLEKLAGFAGMPIDGHAPMLSGQALSAYASAGIASCHESSSLGEAKEKLAKGIAVWIREGSVAKDVEALAPLINAATSPYVGFCTDDRNPLDIAEQGHLDYLIRRAIALGVPMEAAYRAASLSVARHYGLRHVGAIAPGYRADLVQLASAKQCAVARVWKSGVDVRELDSLADTGERFPNTIKVGEISEASLRGVGGRVNVIGVREGKILTNALVKDAGARGVAQLSVVERHGHGYAPANGYAYGFGGTFAGAIVSSVGHDSHNLIGVASNPRDLKVGLECVRRSAGGFAVVRDGVVVASLALPFGGLMSAAPPAQIEQGLRRLRQASAGIGCELAEPFLQLAFLSLPVIPKLKLTDRGLVDVDKFALIPVRAA